MHRIEVEFEFAAPDDPSDIKIGQLMDKMTMEAIASGLSVASVKYLHDIPLSQQNAGPSDHMEERYSDDSGSGVGTLGSKDAVPSGPGTDAAGREGDQGTSG